MMNWLAQWFDRKTRRSDGYRVCTLAFTSLNGYADVAAALTPDQLGEYIRQYLNGQAAAIEAHGGSIVQLNGDRIFACWDSDDGAVQCCRAMSAQRETATEFGGWARARQLPIASIRIGAHAGPVLIGTVPPGSGIRVLGDAVNFTSRLDTLNKEYGTQFLISQAAAGQLGNEWVTRHADKVRVVGQEHPITVLELVGLKATLDEETLSYLATYAVGIEAYLGGRFDDAISAFEQSILCRPDDTLAKLMLARCRELRNGPATSGWDGTYSFRQP